MTETGMIAEVVSIGDELTSGQRLDTNSQWLSLRLGELGVRVLYHTTVGDDLEANVRVFRQAATRADLILATGGLGPTADDLTREALAAVAGAPLELNPVAEAHVRAMFARRQRPMPERNLVQAQFPRGSRLVPNPHGTAPGIEIELPGEGAKTSWCWALPGVPAEMKEMWEQSVAPAIIARLGTNRRFIRTHTLQCFGVGESDLEAMLPDLIRRGRQPTVGITVSRATISLRIVAEGRSDQECQDQIAATEATIHQHLGNLVFGTGDEELQHAVIRLCRQKQRTLSAVELGSGGMLIQWLSEADPERHVFAGGLVARGRLGRTPEQTAELAHEVRLTQQTDLTLGLSDLPEGEAGAHSVGEVHVVVAGPQQVGFATYPYAGHPELLRARAVKQALNFLRLHLLGQADRGGKSPTTRP